MSEAFILNNIAPLVSVCSKDLRPEKYNIRKIRGKEINIGEYDPSQSLLFYSIAVCNADRKFIPTESDKDIKFVQFVVGLFRVIILWMLANDFPSKQTGSLMHVYTKREEDILESDTKAIQEMRRLKRGYEDNDILTWHRVESVRLIRHHAWVHGISSNLAIEARYRRFI